MKEHRCKKCNALLFKAELKKGHVEIKCRSCKTMNVICKEPKKELNLIK